MVGPEAIYAYHTKYLRKMHRYICVYKYILWTMRYFEYDPSTWNQKEIKCNLRGADVNMYNNNQK